MKERPIIFSTEMVKAILDGRKTQTRQVIGSQPNSNINPIWREDVDEAWQWATTKSRRRCPYGVPGDHLWVKETWRCVGRTLHTDNGDKDWEVVEYKASEEDEGEWRSALFMPREDSRLTLEVLNVRVQRVQEITNEDAVAEGMENKIIKGMTDPRFEFHYLWDAINAKREGCSWKDNPWVWVIDFRRI